MLELMRDIHIFPTIAALFIFQLNVNKQYIIAEIG